MKTFQRTLVVLLLIGFSAEVLFIIGVHVFYSSNLPGAPNEAAGRIYKIIVNHGFVRYGTQSDLRVFNWAENLFPFGLVLFFCAALLGLRFGIFKVNRESRKGQS
jgi:F0F1-type ATP synthase assembly protein I